MPPTLIADAAGASPQLAFWRDNFVAAPTGPRDDAAPNPTDPVFLALYPPPAVAARIRSLAWDLRREHRLRGWPLERDCLHVSLHGICCHGDLTPAGLMAIGAACASVALPPFPVGFGHAASFALNGNRALALRGTEGIEGIRTLHAGLGDALRRIGLTTVRRQTEPHVTLLYDARAIDEPVQEIRWTVSEFALVCSLRGRRRHLPLARWRLPEGSRC